MLLFGEYQSVFQLAAALALGLLALESLLESPIKKKRSDFFILLLQVRKCFMQSSGPQYSEVRNKLDELQLEIEEEIDADFGDYTKKLEKTLFFIRTSGLAFFVGSCYLLVWATIYYHKNQSGWEPFVSFLVLIIPIALTLWILRLSALLASRLEEHRSVLENRFLALVDIAWGSV